MAEEIAKLVDAFSSQSSSGDVSLSQRLRSDSSLHLGFRKLYSLINYAVTPVDDAHSDSSGKKLGIELWDQSQIQAVASLAMEVVKATRSLSGTVLRFEFRLILSSDYLSR